MHMLKLSPQLDSVIVLTAGGVESHGKVSMRNCLDKFDLWGYRRDFLNWVEGPVLSEKESAGWSRQAFVALFFLTADLM